MASSLFGYIYYILASFTCCCCPLLVIIIGVIGFMALRKRGKANASPQEAIREGVVQVSQVFNRDAMRRQAMEDDER